MCLEVLKDNLVENAARSLEKGQLASKGYEVSLQLGHGVLSEAARAEADTLAEGTNPLLRIVTVTEIFLIVGFQTEGTKLTRAFVDLLLSVLEVTNGLDLS